MPQDWTLQLDQIERARWDSLLGSVPAAYQQDWAYGEVMAVSGARVIRASVLDPKGEVCALAQIILKPVALIATFALCSYGPVWVKPMSEPEKQIAFRTLRRGLKIRWPRLFAISPDETLKPQGFNRILTGDATVRINLKKDEETLRAGLDGKWRNRLVVAEKSDLKFTPAGNRPGQYQWLLEKEAEQRKSRGYRGLPPDMTIAWQDAKAGAKGADKRAGVLVFRADLGRDQTAAMLFLTHGVMATYHIGWSSDEGRKLGAHNLILWNAMLALKEKGVKVLDLGGVNTGSGAGIARFKLGTGGEVLQRPGSFV